jgi:parallel beta-helix repeat protein
MIGATYPGTNVTIKNNSVVGSSVSMDNAIYIADGATGIVSGNSVINYASVPDTLGDVTDATCGIAVSRGSGNVTVSGNSVGNTEAAICIYAKSNNNTVTNNKLFSTPFNDGVYICSNGNRVQNNVIASSTDSGIRLDTSAADNCSGLSNNNTITNNTINGACVGIIEPSGTTGNVITPNTYSNVGAITSANVCP